MKKNYIAPALMVADVKNETILAGSDTFNLNSASNSYDANAFNARGRRNDYVEDDFAEDFE